jgi:hypothetical protein
MLLQIKRNITIKQLNNQLTREYPYLKLQFYKPNPKNPAIQKLSEDLRLEEVNRKLTDRLFALDPSDSIADVEKRLQKECGLAAEILYGCRGIWLRTRYTDTTTISDQNRKGETTSDTMGFNSNSLIYDQSKKGSSKAQFGMA